MTPEFATAVKAAAASARLPVIRPLLASLSAPMLLASLGTSIANVGLPTLGQAFNASFQQVSSGPMVAALASVPAGRMADRFGAGAWWAQVCC